MSWQHGLLLSNALILLCYLSISAAILVPLITTRQWRKNPMGLATSAIFFTCGVGHGIHASHAASGDLTGTHVMYSAVWDSLTGVVAAFYWALRGTWARTLEKATLFDDLVEQRRLERCEFEAHQQLTQVRDESRRQLQAQADMLKSVVASSHSLIYVRDLNGRILLASPPFLHTFGVPDLQLPGMLGELDPFQDPTWADHEAAARRGTVHSHISARTDLGVRQFDLRMFPIYDKDEHLCATGGVGIDVTDSEDLATDLRRKRDHALAAAEAKAAFLATMSHEIRTPMNAVIGMADLLLDTPLNPDQQEFLHTIRSSGDALLAIINDILDLSKLETGEVALHPAPFALAELGEQALDFVAGNAARKNLALACEITADTPPVVIGDLNRLRQVLANLLSNAVKFTEHGEVVLRIAPGPETQAGMVSFAVSDTGAGIVPEDQRHLFRPFSQVGEAARQVHGGTGLGLAICRRLVEAMGGTIRVTSTPGEGSTFSFTVPLPPTPEAPALGHLPRDSLFLHRRHVLVAIAHQATRAQVVALLRGWGATCLESHDGRHVLLNGGGIEPWGMTTFAGTGIRPLERESVDFAIVDHTLESTQPLRDVVSTLPAHCRIVLSDVQQLKAVDRQRYGAVLATPIKQGALRTAAEQVVERTSSQAMEGMLPPPRKPQDAVAPPLLAQREFSEPPAAAESETPTETGTGVALQVLVAEDNLVNQKVSRLMLERIDFVASVEVVGNGLEAIAALHRRAFDVILMDVQMPELNGIQATQRIRTELDADRQPVIIALTANVQEADRLAALEAGMDGFLSKPFQDAELREALRSTKRRVPAQPTH